MLNRHQIVQAFSPGAPKEGPSPLGEARKVMYGAFGRILGQG
jgi:hypothetical protein